MKKLELYYVPGNFYEKSGTRISGIRLVENGKSKKFDWGFLTAHLEKGGTAEIRQATKIEIQELKKELGKYLKSRK